MLIVILCVDAPGSQTIGVKEAITYDLEEKYGDVRVVSVEEKLPEQMNLWERRQIRGV